MTRSESALRKIGRLLVALLLCGAVITQPVPSYAIGFDAETAYQSVFIVQTGSITGSGFAIGPNCIVTNAHVVEGGEKIRVKAYKGNTYSADVALYDESSDIAVLRISEGSFPFLKVAGTGAAIGDDVYAIGAPESLAYTLTKGIVSAKNRRIGDNSYLQIDAAVNPGNSGGPLVNDKGEVLGIVTMKLSGSEGIGLAIPMESVCSYLLKNGIDLTEQGNVAGVLSSQPVKSQSQAEPTSQPTASAKPSLLIPLCVSVFLNILLLLLLVLKRRKKRKSDSTDFEIDVLE